MLKKLDPKQRTLAVLVGVVLTMGALGFASVPLYDLFCRVTGYGGTTAQADAGSDVILERTINVRFDGSLASGMSWEFKPEQTEMTVRIGETGLAFYEAYNPTNRPIAGQASYNVFPFTAGGYFNKIACFCFTEQVLQPGERIQMPVTFFVDPEIVDDPDGKFVEEITLSYTFYEIDLPEPAAQAALTPEQPAKTTEYN
ncbi:cytochrome c oxidase assembly protein [Litoreibacter janthinus]|uniref:Cytochrome c oxidase assembly protein CtaG n=1 Tax=Litoreibacter janthinus TaxID=670154 RepID=A0A1I6HUM6_9RHOB|nr:cytochrome c oxidase assembly protein [Litoreibacter janthinus]SFR58145.1 cytochrome c oxidase assembly protein subunit 11 [Litoreibacter janthinus]